MRITIEDNNSKAFPICIRWTLKGIKYSNAFETIEQMQRWCYRFGDVKYIDKRKEKRA